MIEALFFAVGLAMGACGLLGYCCVKVGSMHDEEWGDYFESELNDGT